MEWFDRISDRLNFDRFVDLFRNHEDFIMARGLRIVAYACIAIAVFYAVLAYLQYRTF